MMGSISGTSIVSLRVLFGEVNKPWCPLGDGLWKDVLKRATPDKDGAAMPGEWARLGKEKNNTKTNVELYLCCLFVSQMLLDMPVLKTKMVPNHAHLRAAMLDILGE